MSHRKQVKDIKDKLALLKQTPVNIIQQAASNLLGLRESWEYATQEERRTLTQMIVQEVACDVLETRIIWVRPRMGYETLFRLVPELGALNDDGQFHPDWQRIVTEGRIRT